VYVTNCTFPYQHKPSMDLTMSAVHVR